MPPGVTPSCCLFTFWKNWGVEGGVGPQATSRRGFPGDLVVKNPPAMQEMLVWSLEQEDPLEKKTVTCSSILAWEIPWTEEPGGLQSMGSKKSWT